MKPNRGTGALPRCPQTAKSLIWGLLGATLVAPRKSGPEKAAVGDRSSLSFGHRVYSELDSEIPGNQSSWNKAVHADGSHAGPAPTDETSQQVLVG
jgi:hypothetical protein